MASTAPPLPGRSGERRFFAAMALIIATVTFAGLSVNPVLGRVQVSALPLQVRCHALAFGDWIVL